MRLLLLSSRARHKASLYATILGGNVTLLEYSYDQCSSDDILSHIRGALTGQKVISIAMVLQSSEQELYICLSGQCKISLRTLITDDNLKNFLKSLIKENLDLSDWSARLDFFNTYMAEQIDGGLVAKELETMLECQVGLSPDFNGIKVNQGVVVGSLYFDLERLQRRLDEMGKVGKGGEERMKGYEKIRVVGKGAFGQAVLFVRAEDALLCIIKEINLLTLNASDRQLVMNYTRTGQSECDLLV